MSDEDPAPIVRAVVVDCHIEDVFAYLADPTRDHAWCDAPRALLAREPPAWIAWREDDVEVTCELEPVWTSTRVTHREAARGGPWRRRSRRRAVARRLRTLKNALER